MAVMSLVADQEEVEAVISEAHSAGMSGFEDPRIFGERAASTARSLKQSYQSQIRGICAEIEEVQADQIRKSLFLKATEKALLTAWAQTPRIIQNRSEAAFAIETYRNLENQRPDTWQVFSYILFFFEFIFGYWIFKTTVLPDPGIGNHITSILIGAMTLAIGVFLKILPDSTTSTDKYRKIKRWIALTAAASSVAFILLLAFSRRGVESIDISNLVLKGTHPAASHSAESLLDFIFQLSLLATLTFCAAFFSHWKQERPRALIKALSEQGKELLTWYEGDEFKFASTEKEAARLELQIKDLRARKQRCVDKGEYYSEEKILNLSYQAVIEFFNGANTSPATDSKRRAAENARVLLDSIPKGDRKCIDITLASHG